MAASIIYGCWFNRENEEDRKEFEKIRWHRQPNATTERIREEIIALHNDAVADACPDCTRLYAHRMRKKSPYIWILLINPNRLAMSPVLKLKYSRSSS